MADTHGLEKFWEALDPITTPSKLFEELLIGFSRDDSIPDNRGVKYCMGPKSSILIRSSSSPGRVGALILKTL